MRSVLIALLVAFPLPAAAEWASSLSKADAEGRQKRRLVLIYVFTKGDAACDRLEKDLWPVEPVKTRLRGYTAVKIESTARKEPKTWEAIPRWKAQGDGEATAPEIRIIHPWGKELKRLPLKDVTAADLGATLKTVFEEWDAGQAPIRDDTRALDAALKGQDKDYMIACMQKVVAHREPWTIPKVAELLYKPGVKNRDLTIPELRRIDPEDGLWALVQWLKDQNTTAGCDLGWQEVAKASDIRTLPALKENLLSNNVVAVTRIRAIGQFQEKSSIPFLIDQIPRVGAPPKDPNNPNAPTVNPIAAELAASLKKLTGQDFGTEHRKWKEWWKGAERTFEFAK